MGAEYFSPIDFVRHRSSGTAVPASARTTVHFHPDFPFGDADVLESLIISGTYRSQFETGIGNGGLTAFEGGDRWVWEQRMFGDGMAQQPLSHRPKYGALELEGDLYGAAPRFGACFLRLNSGTLERTTFTYPDSVFQPVAFGTADRFALADALRSSDLADPLDRYIEAHVHGILRIAEDVEALVLDPSYRDTPVERRAMTLPVPIEWHPGYSLDLEELPDDAGAYRGPRVVAMALDIAQGEPLTPAALGRARRAARFSVQDIKLVWHLVARYGR